ncbi:MAG: hypothetical protein AAGF11_20390 [Myxococcota bacterium]
MNNPIIESTNVRATATCPFIRKAAQLVLLSSLPTTSLIGGCSPSEEHLLAGENAGENAGDRANPEHRDPWLWPFSADSIWNHPIGANAVFVPANLEAAGHVGIDTQHLLVLDADDPEREALDSPTWGPGRCSGTEQVGIRLPLPDDWIVPDAGNSPYGNTPNSNFALLLPDGDTVFESSKISRCEHGGPFYLPEWIRYPDNQRRPSLHGNGLDDAGGQGASGMSALGGTIRLGELTGDRPLRHAIKLNPYADKYCHYSDEVQGFRWPARSADHYASDPGRYAPELFGRQSDPRLVMGTLLAIPPHVELDTLGLETEVGRRLFAVMQDYGAYFTEDAAWDAWDLIAERGVEQEVEARYGHGLSGRGDATPYARDLNRIVPLLAIVDNTGASTIGGGGTPRAPLAPPLD